MAEPQTIAIVGGAGKLGRGIALRLSGAGFPVVLGSRNVDRAVAAAGEIADLLGSDARISGAPNREAAQAAHIVIVAVPFASHAETLTELREVVQGKILVDATVPLVPPKVTRVQLPPTGSAAKSAQKMLGDRVRVVSAFQNVAADSLAGGGALDCDVLVAGDDPAAREEIIRLASAIGLRAWHAGPIDNAAAAEALTSVLIFLNRHYKVDGAGIRITGVPHR